MVRVKKYVSVSYYPLSITTSQGGACSAVALIAWARPLLFRGHCPMGVRAALSQIKKGRQRRIEDRNDVSNSCHERASASRSDGGGVAFRWRRALTRQRRSHRP